MIKRALKFAIGPSMGITLDGVLSKILLSHRPEIVVVTLKTNS